MKTTEIIQKYNPYFSEIQDIKKELGELISNSDELKSTETLKTLFSLIDLTSLNSTDNLEKISGMLEKVNSFHKQYKNIPNVAAICVYPPFVNYLKQENKAAVKIASVGAGFPSSQTFIDIKLSETAMIAEEGADEIDIVISLGKFLEGDYETVFSELQLIRETVEDVHLKTILESGVLHNNQLVWDASILAMEAGSDFIKTSTGKMDPAATPDAFYIMCKAIAAFYKETGKKIGIKPAGGISTSSEALVYYTIVKKILGKDWLNSELFRIGASRLANNLLSDITGEEVSYF